MENQLKQKRFFITSTGANVGKTIVSRALLQALQHKGYTASGYKPIFVHNGEDDTVPVTSKTITTLIDSSSSDLSQDEISPIQVAYHSIWDDSKSAYDSALLSKGLHHIEDKNQLVLIQGTGGWRSLFNNSYLSQWVVEEKIPVVLVVGIQQGCINHAVLSAECIKHDGLELVGWVANRINPGEGYYAEIIGALQRELHVPMLGELPYLGKPETKDLSRYIGDLTPLLSYGN